MGRTSPDKKISPVSRRGCKVFDSTFCYEAFGDITTRGPGWPLRDCYQTPIPGRNLPMRRRLPGQKSDRWKQLGKFRIGALVSGSGPVRAHDLRGQQLPSLRPCTIINPLSSQYPIQIPRPTYLPRLPGRYVIFCPGMSHPCPEIRGMYFDRIDLSGWSGSHT